MKKEIKLFEKNGITRTKDANAAVESLERRLNLWWMGMEKAGYSFWQIELLAHQSVYSLASKKGLDI